MTDGQDAAGRGGRTAEPRSPRRYRVMQQGRIVLGPDTILACTVRDLSPLGAKIVLSRPVALPEGFSLVIAAHELRTLSVRLRWQRGDVAGVTFDGPA